MNKYFLYAIGEIFLVVVGILIALGINNWNETRKTRALEQELLRQFHTELKADIESISLVNLQYKSIHKSCIILIDHLKNRRAYHDSLAYHFDQWNDYEHFNVNTTALSNLNSRGVGIITNTELRNRILKLYNQSYGYSVDIGKFFREDHVHMSYEIQLSRIEPVEWKKEAIPNDYKKLLDDQIFINHIQWIKNAAKWNSDFFSQVIIEVEEVKELIKSELK